MSEDLADAPQGEKPYQQDLWQGPPTSEVSIIVVNWNTRELLRACLDSVVRHTLGCSFEIIVVDNGSADRSVEMVRETFPGVRLVENARNLGFSAGSNQGLRAARGRFLLLLNSDTRLEEDAAARLVSYMDAHPDAGMAGGRLTFDDGAPQGSCGRFPSVWGTVATNFRLTEVFRRVMDRRYFFWRPLLSYEEHAHEQDVDYILGACMMVRREAVAEAGFLDESSFLFGEEWDWCYRIKACGWRILYTPSIHVVHIDQGSWTLPGTKRVRATAASQYFFFRKHHGRGKAILYKVITGAGSLLKSVMWGLLSAVFLLSPQRRGMCIPRMRLNLATMAWCLSPTPKVRLNAEDLRPAKRPAW